LGVLQTKTKIGRQRNLGSKFSEKLVAVNRKPKKAWRQERRRATTEGGESENDVASQEDPFKGTAGRVWARKGGEKKGKLRRNSAKKKEGNQHHFGCRKFEAEGKGGKKGGVLGRSKGKGISPAEAW